MQNPYRILLAVSIPSVAQIACLTATAGEAVGIQNIPEAIPLESINAAAFSAELNAGYDTDYVFRGLDMGENLVWAGIGASIPVSNAVQLNVGAWYGTLTDANFAELDLSAGVTYDLGPATLGVNYTYYHFARGVFNPRAVANTSDINTTLVSAYRPVNFAFLHSYNTTTDGHYFELGASTTFKFCERAAIVPAASIGYNAGYHPGTTDGFNAVNISLSIPVKLAAYAVLTPYVAASFALDSLEPINASEDILYGGVSVALGF